MRLFVAILVGLGAFVLMMAAWLALLVFVLYPIGIVPPVSTVLSFGVGMVIGPLAVLVGYWVLDG